MFPLCTFYPGFGRIVARWAARAAMCGARPPGRFPLRRPPTPALGAPRWLRTPCTGRTPEDRARPLTLDAQHAGSRRRWPRRPVAAWSGGVSGAAEGGKRYLVFCRRPHPGDVPSPCGGHGPGPSVPLRLPLQQAGKGAIRRKGGPAAACRPARPGPPGLEWPPRCPGKVDASCVFPVSTAQGQELGSRACGPGRPGKEG